MKMQLSFYLAAAAIVGCSQPQVYVPPPMPVEPGSVEAKAALEKVLRGLDSSDVSERETARWELKKLVETHGEALLFLTRDRARESSSEVRSSVEDLVRFRERVSEARKTLAAFDVLDTPDLKGKKLVVYNTGGWCQSASGFEFTYTYGWLLEESADTIRLADESPHCGTIPRWKELPEQFEKFKNTHPKEAPLPGFYREVDFAQFCGELIKNGSTPSAHPYARRESAALINEAVYAYWAFKVGLDNLGLELLAQTQRTFAGPHNDWVKGKESLRHLIEAFMVQHLRAAALSAAHGGEAFSTVLERWRVIAHRLPEKEYPGEAKEMCDLYEKMTWEAAAWVEPKREDLAKLPVEKKVEYWIYHLRDVDASQMSNPGSCDILQTWGRRERKKLYPPDELVKLGWDAIPVLIEHLDDSRPSRSMGWHRSFSPSSYYLLRVGDCCEQIFSAISGESLYRRRSTSGAMVKDGDALATKDKALLWWTEKKKGGAENYFVEALAKPELATTAAEKLLAMDKAKHLPRLIGILERGPRESRNAILLPLAPHLTKEHEKLVETVLGDPNGEAVVTAARVLWDRWRSDRGALEVIARLKAVEADDRDARVLWRSTFFLRSARTENVAKGLAALMGAKSTQVRMHAIHTAASFPHELLAAALVTQLKEKTPTGWSSSFPIRFCDEAASALIAMARLGAEFKVEGSEGERDRTIAGIQSWWEKEGAAVDWSARLRELEKSESPAPGKKEGDE